MNRDIPKLKSFISWVSLAGTDIVQYKILGESKDFTLPSPQEIRQHGFPEKMPSTIALNYHDYMDFGVIDYERNFYKPKIPYRLRLEKADDRVALQLAWESRLFKPGDLIGPATAVLISYSNKCLEYYGGGPRLRPAESGKIGMFITPQYLIGAMWLQFAQIITGKMSIKRCAICGEWEDRTGLDKRWLRHDTCRERLKQQKRRARMNKEVTDDGRDD